MKRSFLLFLLLTLTAASAAAQEPDSLAYYAAADSLYHELSEAVVVGEIPVVKVDKGALVYDLPRILEKTPADNAYEAIGKLPGVMPQGEGFSVAGRAATVVIDGKVSTLSADQVNALLRSTPVSRIAKAEVIPNATAKYQVRGALINIVLNHDAEDRGKLQGEIYGEYANQYAGSGQGRGSLLYTKGKFSTDLIYSYGFNQIHNDYTMEARHRLNDGSIHNISQNELVDTRDKSHQVRSSRQTNCSRAHSRARNGISGRKTSRRLTAGRYLPDRCIVWAITGNSTMASIWSGRATRASSGTMTRLPGRKPMLQETAASVPCWTSSRRMCMPDSARCSLE